VKGTGGRGVQRLLRCRVQDGWGEHTACQRDHALHRTNTPTSSRTLYYVVLMHLVLLLIYRQKTA
jgi:hypothetical protein